MSDSNFDAIIVGARVAGSAAALMLARGRYKVLLLDKATFPSDTLSTHIVLGGGARVLERMGVTQALERAGAARFHCERTLGPDFDYSAEIVAPDGERAPGLCLSRYRMDRVMIDAARDAGATVCEGARVTDVIVDNGAVAGVTVADRAGTRERRAPLTIGADGMRGNFAALAARRIGAFAAERVPCARVYYYAYFSGVESSRLGDELVAEFESPPGSAALICRCEDGRAVVAVAFPADEMGAFRADLTGNFARLMARTRIVSAILSGAAPESRRFSSGRLDNHRRSPVCDGAILLGDAGLHVDPLFGQGHSLALMSAEIMAEMAPRWFAQRGGAVVSGAAMEEFAARRDKELLPHYEATLRVSRQCGLDPLSHAAHRAANSQAWAAREMIGFAQMLASTFPSFRFARLMARWARKPNSARSVG